MVLTSKEIKLIQKKIEEHLGVTLKRIEFQANEDGFWAFVTAGTSVARYRIGRDGDGALYMDPYESIKAWPN